MNKNEARRPLKVRGVSIVQSFAQFLSRKNISPNQISITSVFFAAISAACFIWFRFENDWWLLLLAAVFIQCRLLCNLFDGMVAVEGGKKTNSGELFNDIPDRIADPLILISAGYAIHVTGFNYATELGWSAGLLAVMTAYVRTLAASIGAPVDFQGPMAKQHRMAIVTIACLIGAVETSLWKSSYTLLIALSTIVIGCLITIYRRAVSAYRFLES